MKQILIEQFFKCKDLKEQMFIANAHMEITLKECLSETYDITIPPPEQEIWRNIKGWEGIYQISSFGRIKALERFFIKKNSRSNGLKAVYQPEIIRVPRKNPNGYCCTSLWRYGKATHLMVHRLVALHFIDNPKKYKQVLHKDNNPLNPKWDNLNWGTQKMNIKQAVDEGRWHTGSKNFQTKLKETDIPIIRQLISDGISSHKIGERFGVSHFTILSIKNNKTWKHII